MSHMNDITSHMDVSCHIPPLAPAEPALHLQLFEASLPTDDNELDGQEVHILEDVAPEAAKNVPTEQSRQAVDVELPWYLPDAHSSQPVSAVFAWYLPGEHSVQVGHE